MNGYLVTFSKESSTSVVSGTDGLVEKKVAIEETTSLACTEDMTCQCKGVAQINNPPRLHT